MEELQARHRKEQRDLQAKITQKKKSATKKTRKGVNDECERWQRELKERQEAEISALNGGADEENGEEAGEETADIATDSVEQQQTQSASEASTQQPPPQPQEQEQPAARRKPNRQKARLARRAAEQEAEAARAAEEAAHQVDYRGNEKEVMKKALETYGLKETDIRPDGHCLYSAVAVGLRNSGIGLSGGLGNDAPGYKLVRAVTAAYIESHPDDFAPFLEKPLDQYVHEVRDTAEWGGQIELLAIARAYGVHINVLKGDGGLEKLQPEEGKAKDGKEIWLAYYRHTYGLGEHYNALLKGN
ncbi:hypothetical protein KEM55_002043 [Ascosphaera atra]|nr:hypothetical protein KEM55_002043 [Ascosphaera atra]